MNESSDEPGKKRHITNFDSSTVLQATLMLVLSLGLPIWSWALKNATVYRRSFGFRQDRTDEDGGGGEREIDNL